ncbi:hypothetical protein HD553DRAFT_346798 [Filobasidium floriforme]|uniref:uncharacterized protein n=1 Tax=Filobasidium floriforme TaxID=5210 RepID=UPI001E8E1B62|nr:uncharacterized protein HD553DRAFT_346798 [Filobasidium floriforme]KAH8090277.1 hypothetical protein HD553DRAFT_346798 [Filobasidium floriforme]
MTGSKSILSRFTSFSFGSRTDNSSTNASDPSHQPSGSQFESSALTVGGGGTNATLASECPSTGTDVVVDIIKRSLAANVSPLGCEFLIEWFPSVKAIKSSKSHTVQVTRSTAPQTKKPLDFQARPKFLQYKFAPKEFDLLQNVKSENPIDVEINDESVIMILEKTAPNQELNDLFALRSAQSHSLKVTFLGDWKKFGNLYRTPDIVKYTTQ